MRKKLNFKQLEKFTRGKVLTAFLIATMAIIFSWIISRAIFSDIEQSVNALANPNERLMIVNRLLEKVSKLDQLQRTQALKKNAPTKHFLSETQHIRLTLDTLTQIYTDNESILNQVNSMKEILEERDKVFIQYVTFKSNKLKNPDFQKQLTHITSLVKENSKLRDSTIVTTENKTTTIHQEVKPKEDPSFWKKIFGKKEKTAIEKVVTEEKNTVVDTIAIAKQDEIVKEIDEAVLQMQKTQRMYNQAEVIKELELLNNGNELIGKLWILLNNIQEQELTSLRESSNSLINYFQSSINRAGFVLMVFFLVIAILVFAILTDLTRSNKYRVQLQMAKEDAEHASIMKQRFLSNMSHEIRTPLQSIIGFSEQVKTQEHPDKKMIETIHSSAGHLLHIVNEILDYSRIISGKFVLENRVFNLSHLLTEVADNMQLQAANKKLSFSFINNVNHQTNVKGDDFRLKQVLYNLLGNAVKFTTIGGIVLRIDEVDKDTYKIKVIDSGAGISKQNLVKIFNEFEQTDDSVTRKFGGTGLGLSIAKSLVDTMQGTVEVESELGIGTTFTVTLKLPITDEPTSEALELATMNKTFENLHTIVIDDDPFILSLCDTILSQNNISHQCYGSAEELLNDKWNNNTKILFTDMRLPGKSGLELVKSLKSKLNHVKLIALTAQVLPEEKQRILASGFDAILPKPFREYEFLTFYEKEPKPTTENNTSTPIQTNIIDLSGLRKMTMNDEDLIKSHLSHFLMETEKDMLQMEGYVLQQNQAEIFELIHKLASRTGQIGAVELMNEYRTIEQALLNDTPLREVTPHLSHAISSTKKVMEEVKKLV